MQKTEDGKIIVTKDDFSKLYLKLKSFLAKPNSWKIISAIVLTTFFFVPVLMIYRQDSLMPVWGIIKVFLFLLFFWYCGYKSGRERTDDVVKRVEHKIKDHIKYRTIVNSNYTDIWENIKNIKY